MVNKFISKLLSNLGEAFPGVKRVILKEESIDSEEKDAAILNRSDDEILIFDLNDVRKPSNFAWIKKNSCISFTRDMVLVYYNRLRLCALNKSNIQFLKVAFKPGDMKCNECGSTFPDVSTIRRICGRCSSVRCYQCALRGMLPFVLSSKCRMQVRCIGCEEWDNPIYGPVLDENGKFKIPIDYFKSITQTAYHQDDIRYKRVFILCLMAALLQHYFKDDVDAQALIEVILQKR